MKEHKEVYCSEPQRFNRVGIVLRKDTPGIHEQTLELIRYLLKGGKKVFLEDSSFAAIVPRLQKQGILSEVDKTPMNQIGRYSDVVVVIGGDGTLLLVAREIVEEGVPIIGLNRGRLGFLTQVSWETDSMSMLKNILVGRCRREQRTLLEGSVIRDGEVAYRSVALNEVVISRSGLGNLIEFEVFVDDEFVYTQRSDGLIVSTPTGSTAYSLASGGPILYATLPALNLVPICPQSMSNRPVVISETSQVNILIVSGSDARVHFDGSSFFDLKNLDRVQVKKHARSITLLQPPDYSYFNTLRRKLRWGEQLV
ncbi:MAG: NAD(+)/NADH kinase [Neisseriaceae bacterium]